MHTIELNGTSEQCSKFISGNFGERDSPSRPFVDTERPRNWAAVALIQLQASNYPSTVVFIDKGRLKPLDRRAIHRETLAVSLPEIACNGLWF